MCRCDRELNEQRETFLSVQTLRQCLLPVSPHIVTVRQQSHRQSQARLCKTFDSVCELNFIDFFSSMVYSHSPFRIQINQEKSTIPSVNHWWRRYPDFFTSGNVSTSCVKNTLERARARHQIKTMLSSKFEQSADHSNVPKQVPVTVTMANVKKKRITMLNERLATHMKARQS